MRRRNPSSIELRVHRATSDLYQVAVLPLISFLPAFLAYGLAIAFGDLRCLTEKSSHKEITECLKHVLGDKLTDRERMRIARDFFRMRSCEKLDSIRLAMRGDKLTGLVQLIGREHIEDDLIRGKGAILIGAHIGYPQNCIAILGAWGFRVAPILGAQRKNFKLRPSFRSRLEYRLVSKRLTKFARLEKIHTREGNLWAAVKAASVLRGNGLVVSNIDVPVDPTGSGTSQVEFFRRRVQLPSGAVSMAQLTGAPTHLILMRRSPNWRNQTVEISPQLPTGGNPGVILQQFLKMIEKAILESPAQWRFWHYDDLLHLGLFSLERGASD